MARAVQYSEFGGPEVLAVHEVPDPVPGPGQVAVRVEAAGVNPIDWKLRSGLRPSTLDQPRTPGSDGAGFVTVLGEGVEGLRPGTPVAFSGAAGTYATDVLVAADSVATRPATVTARQAAGLGVPAATAYQALRSLGVGAADVLLIHGGSGAVGQAAIQFARLWGARVLATTSQARADRVHRLGAEPVVYGPGVADRIRAAAPEGVTVILDAAGTDEAIEASLELLTDTSRIATVVRGADAAGWGIQAYSGGSPEPLTARQQRWRAEALPVALHLVAVEAFDVEIGAEYPLERAGEAQQASEGGAPGKLLIIP